MRIYDSVVQCVKETERDLHEMGTRVTTKTYQDKTKEEGFTTKELVGYSFTLTNGSDWKDSFEALGFEDPLSCIAYTLTELSARVVKPSDINPGKSWTYRRNVWDKFLGEDKKFSYTYPERIHDGNQITLIDDLHSRDPHSRQLVIPIYNSDKDHISRGGIARVPCTMYYQILERNKTLFLIHNMRSCDLYTHFPIDLSISWLIAEIFSVDYKAEEIRVIMQFGSLHAFKDALDKRGIF